MNTLTRTEMLLGSAAIDRLKTAKVMIFGIGGVGSYAAESLVRCGIGNFVVVDGDTVCVTNINRQIIALPSTVGLVKAEVARDRMLSINPNAHVTAINAFVETDNISQILEPVDYVIDAIDTVASKVAIIERCNELGIPIISSMGAGNKLHPERFMLADIYETKVCPLAKVMRKKLREIGIPRLKVCYSEEEPIKPEADSSSETTHYPAAERRPPGSISFVPSAVGLIIAGQVVRDIVQIH